MRTAMYVISAATRSSPECAASARMPRLPVSRPTMVFIAVSATAARSELNAADRLPGAPPPFLSQFAGQPFQAQIPPRRGWVHPRLRRRNLLILFRVRQLSQPPHLLVRDHPLAPRERDSRWSH